MDRCRCADYEDAVKKLKFYTVGTCRPDIIENYDKTGFAVSWFKGGISVHDRTFSRAKARKILEWQELPQNRVSKEARKIEQMWCRYMNQYKLAYPEEGDPIADTKEPY